MDEDKVIAELVEKVKQAEERERQLVETVRGLEVAFAKSLDVFNKHIADLHVGHR